MVAKKAAFQFLRQRYAWQYALLIAALAYLFLWDPLRNWWAYETTTAEVTAVRSLCAAFERAHAIPVEVDECDRLREKMATRSDIVVKPRLFATFTYRSPADNSAQTASVVREHDDAGRPISVGSRISVQLSRSEPTVFRIP
ncbi:MAG: hypothetical protein KL863_18250 [Rhizobium sp.]|nr:hypothetical protein [Rhizobium sp.]